MLPGLHFLDGTGYFRVDSRSGVVYLKESLDGMRGQRLMIGAGVNDGVYNAKMDIVIQVTPSDGSELPPSNNRFNTVSLPAGALPPPSLSSGISSPSMPPRPPSPPRLPGSSFPTEVNFSKSKLNVTFHGIQINYMSVSKIWYQQVIAMRRLLFNL